jgi:hypothetical protein
MNLILLFIYLTTKSFFNFVFFYFARAFFLFWTCHPFFWFRFSSFGACLFFFLFCISDTYLTHVPKIDVFEIESWFMKSLTSYI